MTGRTAGTIRDRPGSDRSDPVLVEVLICGSPDRGDDGAGLAAATILATGLPVEVGLRIVGQLDIEDLLVIPRGAATVIVDAATGIGPGRIVSLPLDDLTGGDDPVRPRSSHALAISEVLGLAELLRGRPLWGRIVAVGAEDFRLGQALSEPVAGAIPALVEGVREAIEQLREVSPSRTAG